MCGLLEVDEKKETLEATAPKKTRKEISRR
jgi:hypothetical protein